MIKLNFNVIRKTKYQDIQLPDKLITTKEELEAYLMGSSICGKMQFDRINALEHKATYSEIKQIEKDVYQYLYNQLLENKYLSCGQFDLYVID